MSKWLDNLRKGRRFALPLSLLLAPFTCGACKQRALTNFPAARLVADTSLNWQDLASDPPMGLVSYPGLELDGSDAALQFAALPPEIRSNPKLATLTLNRVIAQPRQFDLGVYGKVGSATFFITTTDLIADWDRLYWVMIKVLSEKYGCFMKEKTRVEDVIQILCRDRRTVVFWRSRGADWIQFYGRQYDAQGRELTVTNRQIMMRSPADADLKIRAY